MRLTEVEAKINQYIGSKVRETRQNLGWTAQDLAMHVGINHQNMSKCESGERTISAARLAIIAKLLDKPILYFYPNEE